MTRDKSLDEKLQRIGEAFPARPALVDAVMASIGNARPAKTNQLRRWIMRSAYTLAAAACVVLAVMLVKSPQSAHAFDLPSAAQLQWQPLGTWKDYDVACKPGVKPYTIAADLSNVEPSDATKDLTDNRRKLLAQSGIVIVPSVSKEFYEIYLKNPAPFVSSDCALHTYHVLLAESLRYAETGCLAPKQALLASAALERMKAIKAEVGEALAPAATDALVYWAVAARLADPKAVIPAEVEEAVARQFDLIEQGRFIGKVDAQGFKRDYTIFQPIAGYDATDELKRYFILNRYFTLWTEPFDTDRGAQACMLSALAVGTSEKALAAWHEIAQYRELLGGLGEDPTPITLLASARQIFGDKLTVKSLADADSLAKLRKAVAAQPRPGVADQPQTSPGADPMVGYGMRIFPPGVTVRALAFQDVGPRGEHIASLLGNELPAIASTAAKLQRAKDELIRRGKDATRQDVHTLSMLALSRLSPGAKEGYPSFMTHEAWQLKTANAQLGAWSEIEHDLCLYVKDNALYASAPMPLPETFHGYVEPNPAFYAALASLTARTRDAFAQLGAFKLAARDAGTRPADATVTWRPAVVVTADHFKALETLLLHLRDMSVKELENRTFDEDDIKLLKGFGQSLKHLTLNDSTSDNAREPMSVIVRIAREYQDEKGHYVGVGRPMKIIAVVPYAGKLYCATGGVYSYYEFDEPLRNALADKEWKQMTAPALEVQARRAWLIGRGVGLDAEDCPADRFRAWLPKEKAGYQSYNHMLCSSLLENEHTMSLLASLGTTHLTPEAIDVAAKEWAEAPLNEHGMAAMYILLKDVPAEKRAAIGAAAMAQIAKALADADNHKMDSCAGRAWLYFTLRLMGGTKPDEQTLKHVRAYRDRAEAKALSNHYATVMAEIRDAADVVLGQ